MSNNQSFLSQQWRSLLVAIQFFTRVPIHLQNFEEQELNQAAKFFPLIGLFVGSVSALVYVISNLVLPLSLAVIISMAASILLTGAFHEDGLADMADGFGGGWGKAKILEIMVDSRVGSYGAIALVMTLLLKHQTLVSLSNTYIPACLIAGHTVSRLFPLFVMRQLPYVKTNGKSKPLATKLTHNQLIIAVIFAATPLLLLPMYCWIAILASAVTWRFLSKLMHRKIGGYTGDCLGAVQQLTELSFYLGVIICFELNLYLSL